MRGHRTAEGDGKRMDPHCDMTNDAAPRQEKGCCGDANVDGGDEEERLDAGVLADHYAGDGGFDFDARDMFGVGPAHGGRGPVFGGADGGGRFDLARMDADGDGDLDAEDWRRLAERRRSGEAEAERRRRRGPVFGDADGDGDFDEHDLVTLAASRERAGRSDPAAPAAGRLRGSRSARASHA